MARKTFSARVRVNGKAHRVDVAVPKLVGVMEAAQILGVPKPNISRLRRNGRMPKPVIELGAGPLWLEAEVARLARELARERDARTKAGRS